MLNEEKRKEELLEIWQKLMDDKVDSVKIRAAESSVSMIKLVREKGKMEEYMKNFFKIAELKQKNWRVRYVVGEMFPQLVNSLSKDIIKNYGIGAYEQLLKDSEPEVRSIGVQTLYSLLSNLPSSQLGQFVQLLQGIASDVQLHVRLSLADQLCKISSVYSIENIISQMIPIAQQLFSDEVLEIKCKLVHNLPQLAQVLGSENTKKHVMGMLQQLENEKQWRFRLEVMAIIPKLLKITGIDQLDRLSEIMSVLNHYQAIRDQAILNYIELKDIFGYDKIKPHILSVINLLADQTNYVYRVSAIQALVKFKSVLTQPDFNQIYLETLRKLVNDSVPNVRLNCFRTYPHLKDKLTQNAKNEVAKLAKEKQNDSD